ncbi:MAG TPA: endonuclease/exonuclease/phosphatase family protein [bacterium]|nr:endonuclease/exonuclease/phosphatase family protein [bacterium]
MLFASSASLASSHGDEFTYFSANILYCDITAGEERDSYISRRNDLIALLSEMKPDVIGIQEASICRIYGHPSTDHTIKEISKGLKEHSLNYSYYFWESERIGSLWIEGLAFLWNKDIIQVGKDDIECRHLDASYLHKGALIQKSLCRIKVQPKNPPEGSSPVLIYNTHFDARNYDIKLRQAEEVSGFLDKEVLKTNSYALFGGDLNYREFKPLFTDLGIDLLLRDRVDYVFSAKFAGDDAKAEAILLYNVEGKPDISDHNGILTTVRWPAR